MRYYNIYLIAKLLNTLRSCILSFNSWPEKTQLRMVFITSGYHFIPHLEALDE